MESLFPVLIAIIYVLATAVAAIVRKSRMPPGQAGPVRRLPQTGRSGGPDLARSGGEEKYEPLAEGPGGASREHPADGPWPQGFPGRKAGEGAAQPGAPWLERGSPFGEGDPSRTTFPFGGPPAEKSAFPAEYPPPGEGLPAGEGLPGGEGPLPEERAAPSVRPPAERRAGAAPSGAPDAAPGEEPRARLKAPAAANAATASSPAAEVRELLATPESVARAVLLSEILGPPRALNPYRLPQVGRRRPK